MSWKPKDVKEQLSFACQLHTAMQEAHRAWIVAATARMEAGERTESTQESSKKAAFILAGQRAEEEWNYLAGRIRQCPEAITALANLKD